MTELNDRAEIFSGFLAEVREHNQIITENLLKLEKNPQDISVIGMIMRGLHSIKGAARVVGFPEIEKICHSLETIMSEVRIMNVPVSQSLNDLFFSSIDSVEKITVNAVEGRAGSIDVDSILSALTEIITTNAAKKAEVKITDILPGIHPEMKVILTDYQESRLKILKNENYAVYEISIFIKYPDFTAVTKEVTDKIKQFAEIISKSGISEVPEGYDLNYLLLVATKESSEKIREVLKAYNCTVIDAAKERKPEEKKTLPPAEEDEMQQLYRTIFLEAAGERLTEFNNCILSLEKDPASPEIINDTFRIAHNLKGSAATCGFPAVSNLSHEMENVLDRARQGGITVTPALVDVLFKGLDVLKKNIDLERENKPDAQIFLPVLRELNKFLIPTDKPAAAQMSSSSNQVLPEETAPVQKEPQVKKTASAAGDTIRVSLVKIDKMISLVSEMLISKDASDQRFAAFSRLLDYIKKTRREIENILEDIQTDKTLKEVLKNSGISHFINVTGSLIEKVSVELSFLIDALSADEMRTGVVIDQLQKSVMAVRMLPVSTVFSMFPRMVRDLSRNIGKKINLIIKGEETELDRKILEALNDPLTHIIRNAVDHAIEPEEIRLKDGKPAEGTVILSAYHQGNQVYIEIEDDGRGINPEKCRQTAVKKGLMNRAEADSLSDPEAVELIFRPGFSTVEKVTAISGRGVGMDVVLNNIEKLKGSVSVQTTAGKGAKFILKLPLTLAIVQALMIKAGEESFFIPTTSIEETILIGREDIQLVQEKEAIHFRGKIVPLVSLGEVLNIPTADNKDIEEVPAVIAGSGDKQIAFVVDKLLVEQPVVIKSLGTLLSQVDNIAGATILGSGEVVTILDVPGLIRAVKTAGKKKTEKKAGKKKEIKLPRILVVEDSLSTRELLKNILEQAGNKVETAINGAEALEMLKSYRPDLVVTDVSMPVMDGFELTSRIKKDPVYKEIPVVIVTSLESEEEKLKGLQAGADRYIIKGSFEQKTLVNVVEELI